MTEYKPHKDEVPPQAKDYRPMPKEQQILWEQDRIALDQAITWLDNFWWKNRGLGANIRTKEHAAWETDRAIMALISLKNAPSFEKSQPAEEAHEMTLNVERHQDYIAEVQSKYADTWARALVGKRDADMRRKCEQPLGYYVHDMIRRIFADIGIENPILLKCLIKRTEKQMQEYINEEC